LASLPDAFLEVPIAHRGLHGGDVPENSRTAVARAAAEGYGIEIDVQPSRDGSAMVFHDATLERMTFAAGRVDARTAAELAGLTLSDSGEGIPTLAEVLQIAGQAPLLIELKDQSGDLGPAPCPALIEAVATALDGHPGPVAAMSFNPALAASLAARCPGLAVGLVTEAFRADDWPRVPAERRERLATAEGLHDDVAFLSCGRRDLDRAPIRAAKARGLPVLTWTIRSAEQAAAALRIADQITFEEYRPALTGPAGTHR